MRINPFFSNVCGNRIGMYRQDQCTANGCCKFLPYCDQHYIENTGEWDYPNRYPITKWGVLIYGREPTAPKKAKRKKHRGKNGQQSVREYGRLWNLVMKGKASFIRLQYDVETACKRAGL